MKQLLLFINLFISGIVLAAPYHGEKMTFYQPDGTAVEVLLYGDEYYMQAESLDGYTLIRDENGWICYAELSEDGRLRSTSEKYHLGLKMKSSKTIEKHLKPSLSHIKENYAINKTALDGIHSKSTSLPSVEKAISGSYLGLTILVDFSDAPSKVDVAKIDSLCNGKNFTINGNYGSLNKFYKDISYGKVDYKNIVVGPFRAPKTYKTYDNMPYGDGAKELISAALKWLDEQGFNFNTLTLNSENRIMALNIILSGYPQGWGKGMWYHKGWHGGNAGDGVKTSFYNLSPSNPPLKIGTICHENGHMLCGWPDTYKYSGAEDGIGRWDLMCTASGTHPSPPNPFFRNQVGWGRAIELNNNDTYKTAKNDEITYKITNPNDEKEFYLIENRKKEEKDQGIPDNGLTIWHIDKNYDTQKNADMEKQRVFIENAFAQPKSQHLAPFDGAYADEFSANTFPSSNWHTCKSNLSIDNISEIADTMTFRVSFNENKLLNKDNWQVLDAETNSQKGQWEYLIDNMINTVYSYASRSDKNNAIILDLAASWDIEKLKYLPQYNNSTQTIKHYEIFLSEDSAHWGESVCSGTLEKNGLPKYLPINATGRYLKLIALSDSIIPLQLQIAELYAYGSIAPHSIATKASTPIPADQEGMVFYVRKLEWAASEGAESYNIYLSKNPDITDEDLIENTSDTNTKLKVLEKASTYYWRVDAINANGINQGHTWAFSTIADNIARGKSVKTSSAYNTSYIGSKLTDGDNHSNESRWLSAKEASYPHWVEINLEGTYRINMYRVFTGWDGYNKPINDFVFQYQENEKWITVDSIVGNTSSQFSSALETFTATKVRLYITKSSEDMVRMFEIELYGEKVETASKTHILEKSNLKLYPNPANNILQIEGLAPSSKYKIFDLNGNCIQQGQTSQQQININQLKPGFYLMCIADKQYLRFIKE